MNFKKAPQLQTKKKRTSILTRRHFIIAYLVFSVSVFFRIYQISHPNGRTKPEIALYNDFAILANGSVPFDINPISGRFILFFPQFFLTKGDNSLIPSIHKYIRSISGLASSLVPPLITLTLLIEDTNEFCCLFCGLMLAIDPCMVITSRTYTVNVLLLILVAFEMFLSALGRRMYHPLLIQCQCLCAIIATCTDFSGLLCFPFLLLATSNVKKLLPDLISLFVIFISVEITMKTIFCPAVSEKFYGEPFSVQVIETVKALRTLFVDPPSYSEALAFPLGKLPPQTLYENCGIKVCIPKELPMIILIDFALVFNIMDIHTLFFWLSLSLVWLFKKVDMLNCSLPILFGIVSFCRRIKKFPIIVQKIVLPLILFAELMYFSIYRNWIYGTEASPNSQKLLSFFNF